MYNEDGINGFTVFLIVLGVLLFFGAATGLAFCAHAASIADKATLGRVEQNVDTRNYEESAAQLQGLRRDFDNLVLEYRHEVKEGDTASANAVLSVICHRAQGVREDLLPTDIKSFTTVNCH